MKYITYHIFYYLCIEIITYYITLKITDMERKTIITTEKLENIPTLGCSFIGEFNIPQNIIYNKVYYIYNAKENSLRAFKVLAVCFAKLTQYKSGLLYYVQYCDTKTPTWVANIFESPNVIYDSVEDCVNCKNRFKIKYEPLVDGNDYLTLKGLVIKRTYYWNRGQLKPILTHSRINGILITEDCVYISIEHTHCQYGQLEQGYATYEECAMAHLNGLKVIDFPNENGNSIKLKITIEKQQEPSVKTYHFVEE